MSAVWSFLDDGSDQGSVWAQVGFDDSSWQSGVGEFGYGDGDEATVIPRPASGSRHPSHYFVHDFVVTEAVGTATVSGIYRF